MATSDEIEELIALARLAREAAYAPYSGFSVGAAVRAADGKVYTGCNVENASFGLTLCAERNAIAHAVAEGQQVFDTIAVVSEQGVTPCGACRQFLAEFGHELKVIVAPVDGPWRQYSMDQLLPNAFVRSDLDRP